GTLYTRDGRIHEPDLVRVMLQHGARVVQVLPFSVSSNGARSARRWSVSPAVRPVTFRQDSLAYAGDDPGASDRRQFVGEGRDRVPTTIERAVHGWSVHWAPCLRKSPCLSPNRLRQSEESIVEPPRKRREQH